MDVIVVLVLLAAGVGAGMVNALAGGGSLISYPALLAVGVPPISANVTNSVSVAPGYVGSVIGSRSQLKGQRQRIIKLIPTACLGALAGTALLLTTPPSLFEAIVPFLIITAAILMALGPTLNRLLASQADAQGEHPVLIHVLIALACVYGGYFLSAIGLVVMAFLAICVNDSLPRMTALKNIITMCIGLIAATVYSLLASVEWTAVMALVPATLLGGWLGAKLGPRLPQKPLRWVIIAYGLTVGIILLVRYWWM
ncbi:sulfite exporter TauE/SafE family protein [Natronoglycomyces albus]|uniref:Probable membrane transporter protein n=1 Tax=Natronoglycomyces albus TaxID=2811108 RepID=A0A895XSE9_9ACTN|nr:sulfite exporter TauE/SafE family protein [Natronoglycomyces albus]QSB06433.1 sulfite exporter TauE/SafE family protein [Natronoglycomyces albus]